MPKKKHFYFVPGLIDLGHKKQKKTLKQKASQATTSNKDTNKNKNKKMTHET